MQRASSLHMQETANVIAVAHTLSQQVRTRAMQTLDVLGRWAWNAHNAAGLTLPSVTWRDDRKRAAPPAYAPLSRPIEIDALHAPVEVGSSVLFHPFPQGFRV